MKVRKTNWGATLVVAMYLFWTVVPIVLMLQQAVKPNRIMFSDPPKFFFMPTDQHFSKIFTSNTIVPNMINSIIVGSVTVVLCLVFGSICAYALARLNIPGKSTWAFSILMTRMVPVGALMMPLYVIIRQIGLANTYPALIIAHTTLNLPFAIWLLRSHFNDIPIELEEAARIDGCSKLKTFTTISLPLAIPGLVTTAIITMLNSWNEFMFALILTGIDTRTLPVGISSFVGSVSVDWGGSSAAAALATIPIFVVAYFIQKYLIQGLSAGAIKG